MGYENRRFTLFQKPAFWPVGFPLSVDPVASLAIKLTEIIPLRQVEMGSIQYV